MKETECGLRSGFCIDNRRSFVPSRQGFLSAVVMNRLRPAQLSGSVAKLTLMMLAGRGDSEAEGNNQS